MIEQTLDGQTLELSKVQEESEQELLAKQNVTGVALGNKVTEEEDTGEPAIVVLVESKLSKDLLPKADLVPATIKGVATDVVEVGEIFAGKPRTRLVEPPARERFTLAHGDGLELEEEEALEEFEEAAPLILRQRRRPAMGGFSVGHYRVTAGTIATCCYDMSPFPGIPRRYYILSNNHVLANSNAANVGDPILQPGRVDGGQMPADVIGRLSRWITIRWKTPTETPRNYVDAAIAEGSFSELDREIFWVGYVKGINPSPRVGDIVEKTGRTTNFTTGRIQALNATVNVNYGGGRVATFSRQIVTTNMSAPGDSGSLVCDTTENAVGLLFAGSSQVTIMNNILYVQRLLRIRLHER